MGRLSGWMVFWVMLAFSVLAKAETPVLELTGSPARLSLQPYLQYLADPSKGWGLREVQAKADSLYQAAPAGTSLELGYTDAAYWLKFRIRNRSSQELRLNVELNYPPLDLIEFYSPDSWGYTKDTAGDTLPFWQRSIHVQDRFVFPVSIKAQKESSFYIRVTSRSSLTLPLHLSSNSALLSTIQDQQFVQGLFYGIALGLFVYNLFLFLSTREASYLYYVLIILSNLLYTSSLDGLGYRLLPEAVSWQHFATHFYLYLSSVFLIQFCRAFLLTHENTPRLDKLLVLLIAIYVLGMISLPMVDNAQNAQVALWLLASSFPIMLSIAFYRGRQGYKPAQFFLVGWLVYFIPILLIATADINALPCNYLAPYIHKLGMAGELIVFSLGLAYRVKDLKERQKMLQLQAMAAQEETKTSGNLLKRMSEYATEQQQRFRTAHAEARTDQLTALGNRKAFDEDLDDLLKTYIEVSQTHAKKPKPQGLNETNHFDVLIAMIDLDGMKLINDSRGHAEGDRMLQLFGLQLQSLGRRDSDGSYRFGGDEFALLLPFGNDIDIQQRLNECIHNVQQQGFPELGLSVGFATFSETNGEIERSLYLADLRMYKQKESKGRRR